MRPTFRERDAPRKLASAIALIGSYLTQIGLSENVVVYITQAAPTEMTWLTFRDAKQIGIEVVPWETEKVATNPTQLVVTLPPRSQDPTPRSQDPMERFVMSREQGLGWLAQLFVSDIHSRWSSNTNRLEWLDPLYAEEVNFYGNMLSRVEVLIEKRLFIERWPERSYRIQEKSMNAACNTVECIVTGTVDWATRSLARDATASGLASFTYVLRASGNTFVIKGEDGSVLQRRK
jgi:hypothetical protein